MTDRSVTLGLHGLETRPIWAAGRSWSIASAQDEDALLELAQSREPFPFGLLLWEGAIALADHVADHWADLPSGGGQNPVALLELGCGVGLGGLGAASVGARVTMTDHDPLALDVARANAVSNGIEGVDIRLADWEAWNDANRYDVVIGADVLYDRAAHGHVLAILDANLRTATGTALFADPGRHEQAAFVAAATQAGYVVASHVRHVADLKSPTRTIGVTILQLTKRA